MYFDNLTTLLKHLPTQRQTLHWFIFDKLERISNKYEANSSYYFWHLPRNVFRPRIEPRTATPGFSYSRFARIIDGSLKLGTIKWRYVFILPAHFPKSQPTQNDGDRTGYSLKRTEENRYSPYRMTNWNTQIHYLGNSSMWFNLKCNKKLSKLLGPRESWLVTFINLTN